jgi:AraC-like DNA-binding protein
MFFISTSIFQCLLSFSSKKGIKVDDLLKKAGIDKSLLNQLNNIDNKIPLEEYYRLLDSALDMTKDPYFGLHMGETSNTQDLSIFGHMIASCHTIREAFEKVGKYYGMIGSLLFIYTQIEGGNVKIVYDMRRHFPNECIKHCIESSLLNFYNMVRNIASKPVEIKEVWLKSKPPEDMSEYKRIFNCPVLFDQPVSALVFPSKILDFPLKYPNPALLALLEHHANSFLSKIDENDYLSRRISLLLFEQIQGKGSTIENVAENLHMSIRNMQHLLKKEGITFREIYNNVRKELAKSYLAEKHYTIDDISYLLGFSEPSVFRKAFKAWTGMTPGNFRSSSEPAFRP